MCSKFTLFAVLLLILQANAADAGDEQEWASKRGTFSLVDTNRTDGEW